MNDWTMNLDNGYSLADFLQIPQIIGADADLSSPAKESNLQIWNRLDTRITTLTMQQWQIFDSITAAILN